VYQARRFKDILFPWVMSLLGYTGRFWFALAGISNDVPSESDVISGSIFIFKSKSQWREKGEPFIRPIIQEVNLRQRFSEQPNRNNRIMAGIRYSKQRLRRGADIQLRFVMHRTGEVFFTHPEFSDATLRDASIEFAKTSGHDFPKWIVDQAYFFLRDICHRHQHHSPNDDTILISQYRKPDDSGWRRNILYSLHYQIIRAKRSDHGFSAIQAAGILAYAISFRSICEQHIAGGRMDWLPQFNEISQKASLDAQIGQAQWRDTKRLAIETRRQSSRANIRAYMLGFVALAIASVGVLVQPHIQNGEGGDLNTWSTVATQHIAGIILTLLSLLIAAATATSDLFKRRLGKDILEAAHVHRRPSRYIFFAAGLALLVAGFYFGRDAVSVMTSPILAAWNKL
jgi:hypothetical protein